MSQYGIVDWVLHKFKQPGIFLEAGASNPVDQSNTQQLELNGWRGLCVEPRTIHNEDYKQHRPNTVLENYALVDREYKDTTIFAGVNFHCSGVTTAHTDKTDPWIHEYENWPVCRLETLLKKHKLTHIDFFSLDVEGYEHHVLDGTDFNYTTFNIILIEMHDYNLVNRTDDFSYLEQFNYVFKGYYPGGRHKIYTHKSFLYEEN